MSPCAADTAVRQAQTTYCNGRWSVVQQREVAQGDTGQGSRQVLSRGDDGKVPLVARSSTLDALWWVRLSLVIWALSVLLASTSNRTQLLPSCRLHLLCPRCLHRIRAPQCSTLSAAVIFKRRSYQLDNQGALALGAVKTTPCGVLLTVVLGGSLTTIRANIIAQVDNLLQLPAGACACDRSGVV
jgi:hypothetical protein